MHVQPEKDGFLNGEYNLSLYGLVNGATRISSGRFSYTTRRDSLTHQWSGPMSGPMSISHQPTDMIGVEVLAILLTAVPIAVLVIYALVPN